MHLYNPRTEGIFRTNFNNTEEFLSLNNEIQKGIFLASTIIPQKGYKHVK